MRLANEIGYPVMIKVNNLLHTKPSLIVMFYTDCDNIEIAIYAIATLPDSDKCQLVFIQKGWSSVFSLLLA